jgi:hypothetical protein
MPSVTERRKLNSPVIGNTKTLGSTQVGHLAKGRQSNHHGRYEVLEGLRERHSPSRWSKFWDDDGVRTAFQLELPGHLKRL